METYPNPTKLREESLIKGISGADSLVQKAMVDNAQAKMEASLVDLEDKEMYDTTSYGQMWISDNITFLAEKIISRPTNEILKAYLGFPAKLKIDGMPAISTSAYMQDTASYRSKGIKYVKAEIGKKQHIQQVRINDFVTGVMAARGRAMTAAFIMLTELLSNVMRNSNKTSDKEDVSRDQGTATSAAGHIIKNVLQQLLILKGKELKTFMEIPSVARVTDIDKFIGARNKLTAKGVKLLKILNLKSINSLSKKSMLCEGRAMLVLVEEALSEVHIINGKLVLDEDCLEKLNDCRTRTLTSACEARPVLERPVSDGHTTSYTDSPLKQRLLQGYSGVSDRGVSDFDRQAIDRIQGTAFSINRNVLKATKAMVERGINIPKKLCLEVPDDLEPLEDFPARSDYPDRSSHNEAKREWFETGMLLQDPRLKDKLDENGKVVPTLVTENVLRYRKWKEAQGKRKKSQAKAHSINDMNLRVLEIAQWYADYGGAFYLPCYLDYRTRVYYCPTILNPQSSKLAKALFVASRGKTIGTKEALDYWYVSFTGTMTNVTGRNGAVNKDGDKTSWNDAVYIGKQELKRGAAVAASPLEHVDYIASQEDPFAYLAHCGECAGILEFGTEFVSKIFISMDGSCNAYQHAAGYLHDAATAELVNLTWRSDDDIPADMYGTVAEFFGDSLTNEDTLHKLLKYHEAVNRGSCKRITMCLGYGLTQGGAKNYGKEVIEEFSDVQDYNPFDVFGRKEASDGFAIGVWESVAKCAPAVIKVKDALASMGELVATYSTDGIIKWTTSTGTDVEFTKYYERTETVKRVAGNKTVNFNMKVITDKVDAKSVANATAPNYTHSRDADHIRKAVMAMPEGCSYLMIHDSFGTLCADAPEFGRVIRETFVGMYEHEEPLMDFFRSTMSPVLSKIGFDVDVTVDQLETYRANSKAIEDKTVRKAEAGNRAIAGKVIKVLRNIEQTNDMDFGVIKDCRYSFR
jgi:hypothetical protein